MMYWKYNAGEDMFYFKVKAKATGWVAFGVSTQEKGMNGYDVMIGGVDNNGAEYIGVSHLKRVHVYAALNSSNGSQGKKKRTREHSSIYP